MKKKIIFAVSLIIYAFILVIGASMLLTKVKEQLAEYEKMWGDHYDINKLKKDSMWPTALASLLVLSLAGVVVWFCVRRKRKKIECES